MNAISIDRAVAARDVAAHLGTLLRRERAALADFLLALAGFDRERGWRELGYAGMFPFLHRELRLSRAAAYFRKVAAELVQRFPEIVEPIRDGRLCLTSVVELSKVLTAENKESVLPRFFHCSKQEAKAVSAELKPEQRPAQRAVVTTLPILTRRQDATAPKSTVAPGQGGEPAEASSEGPRPDRRGPGGSLDAEPLGSPVVAAPPAAPPRDAAEPLTAELRRLHVTVSKRFLDKLDAARAALSHSLPGASIEAVLEAGLDLVLANDARKKGLVSRPRPAPPAPPPGSRQVPAAVRRAVWERDGGRCQWRLVSGGICGSTYQVELDHTRPVGQGGRSTVEGTRLLCKPHNDLAARLAYGEAWMDRYTGRMRRAGPGGLIASSAAPPPRASPST